MPNWVYNSLLIEGDEDTIDKLRATLKKTHDLFDGGTPYKVNQPISFHNIRPITPEEATTIGQHGAWGTKWDACNPEEQDADDVTQLIYTFETAWYVPVPVMYELATQWPTLDISLDFEEETGWFGELQFKDGVMVKESFIEPVCHQDYVDGDRVCQCENDEARYEDCPNYEDPED